MASYPTWGSHLLGHSWARAPSPQYQLFSLGEPPPGNQSNRMCPFTSFWTQYPAWKNYQRLSIILEFVIKRPILHESLASEYLVGSLLSFRSPNCVIISSNLIVDKFFWSKTTILQSPIMIISVLTKSRSDSIFSKVSI